MRSGRKLAMLALAALFAVALAVTTGCQKKAAPPEDMSDSASVVDAAQKAAEERAAAERRAAEERAAAERRAAEEKAAAERRAAEERAAAEAAMEQQRVAEAAKIRGSHTVKKGDCLWTISESGEIYGDPFQWPIIYKANRNQIKDPDLIYPNQEFDIPRNSSQDEINSAVHEAKTRGPWSLWDGK